MTREDIIKMAREAGFMDTDKNGVWITDGYWDDELRRFATLVAAAERKRIESTPWGAGKEWIARAIEAEREACAKVCDEKVDAEYKTGKVDHNEMGWTQACAIAIRARGEK